MQDRVLTWYIKYYKDKPGATLVETQKALNNEFKKPKSQAQSIIEFKEIKKVVNESSWDFDQRLKFLIQEAKMNITNEQQKEWYFASLFPYLRLLLSQ